MAINWKHYYSDALLRIFVRTPHEEKFRELAEYLEANFNYRSHGDPSESNRYKMSREVIDDHISRFRELRTNQHFAGINLNELTLERVTLLLLKVLPSSRISAGITCKATCTTGLCESFTKTICCLYFL